MTQRTSQTHADAAGAPERGTSRRVLDPMDRISEVLFGVIMALTFTSTVGALEGGRDEVHTLLVAALGCNVAWGIVDAVMYLMACLEDRASTWRLARSFVTAGSPAAARDVLAGALPPAVVRALRPEHLEQLRAGLAGQLEVPPRPSLSGVDWLGAVAVFFLVTLTTFPVAVPFLVVGDAVHALRISNAVAIGMLFLTGFAFGRLAGMRPWLTGLAMVVLGVALVAVTIALGG
jgi:hypothetical protein